MWDLVKSFGKVEVDDVKWLRSPLSTAIVEASGNSGRFDVQDMLFLEPISPVSNIDPMYFSILIVSHKILPFCIVCLTFFAPKHAGHQNIFLLKQFGVWCSFSVAKCLEAV